MQFAQEQLQLLHFVLALFRGAAEAGALEYGELMLALLNPAALDSRSASSSHTSRSFSAAWVVSPDVV